eukprot:c3690_g1_i1 orf=269-1381(-)
MSPAADDNNNAGVDHASLLCTEDACGSFFDEDATEHANAKCENDNDEDASAKRENDNDEDGYGLETSMFAREEYVPLELQNALYGLLEREKHYAPQADFALKMQSSKGIDASSRKKAVSWLLKMGEFFKFTAYTSSLSINYLDRFLSLHHLPTGNAWTLQLLSVACLSLAAKMEEIEAPVLLDLQVGADLVFEPRTVQRMELLVLSTLGWRMSSVTPISYTNYFINRLDLATSTKRVLISRMNELILSSARETRFLWFPPSSIAAAATLCAFQEALPLHFAEQKRYLQCALPHQSQVELTNCCALMMELFGMTQCSALKEAESSVPQSPVAVLDASFSSNSISNITINCHSCPPISSPSPPKKRRMDAPS